MTTKTPSRSTPQTRPATPGTPGTNRVWRGSIDAARRHELIEQIAYGLARERGFVPGRELHDWLAAEAEVDQILQGERYSGD